MNLTGKSRLSTCIGALVLLGVTGQTSHAETHGPLFDELRTTASAERAEQLQALIWDHWREDADAETLARLAHAKHALAVEGPLAAVGVYDHLLAHAPDYVHGLNARATLLYLLGELRSSMRDVERVLALEPRHFGAIFGKGLIHLRRDEFAQARTAFEEVLAVNPHAEGVTQALALLAEREAAAKGAD